MNRESHKNKHDRWQVPFYFLHYQIRTAPPYQLFKDIVCWLHPWADNVLKTSAMKPDQSWKKLSFEKTVFLLFFYRNVVTLQCNVITHLNFSTLSSGILIRTLTKTCWKTYCAPLSRRDLHTTRKQRQYCVIYCLPAISSQLIWFWKSVEFLL